MTRRLTETPQKTLEQAIAAYMQALESGHAIDVTAFRHEHAHLEPEIGEFIAGHQEFEKAASSVRETLAELESEDSEAAEPSTESVTPGSVSLSTVIPKELGNYQILAEIDRGGMGVVYQARDARLGRIVALKVIRSGNLASDVETERFLSEAAAAAALNHPGIVPIYESGTIDGLVYYTMAYIEGQNLEERQGNFREDLRTALQIVYQLCHAVSYAHEHGVYHRDLKPANVLLDNSGQPILIDFGLAKFIDRDAAMTQSGQILGTPAYIAPENAAGGGQATEASETYALGAILYFLCTGQAPFVGNTAFDVLLQVLDREPATPSRLNSRLGSDIDFVCRKALEKKPELRYGSPSELAKDLRSLLDNEPLRHPKRSIAERFESWWRREPVLVAHVIGIGVTLGITIISNIQRGTFTTLFWTQIALLFTWLLSAWALQSWFVRTRSRDRTCLTWATVDVVLYTILLVNVLPPRAILLIGYPMLIVASSLFLRARYIIFMTAACIAGSLALVGLTDDPSFSRPTYVLIFTSGLAVICLSLLAVIRRLRGISGLNARYGNDF